MQVKKFQANSMPEALKLVKAEFGLDAMILNSREERRKGIMGLFRKPYVEITAAMGTPSPGRGATGPSMNETLTNTREEFRNAMLEPLAREVKLLKDKVENLIDRDCSGDVPKRLSMREEFGGESTSELSDNTKQDGFEKVLWHSGNVKSPFPVLSPEDSPPCGRKAAKGRKTAMSAFTEELQQNGVDTEIARTIVERIIPFIGRNRKTDALKKGLKQALESLVDFTGMEVSVKGGRRIIALVGPAGVGKTTTIAKIATNAAEQGKKVAIITADTSMRGATENLKRHAGRGKIVIDTALNSQQLVKAMKNQNERDIILIDTAGVSPNDHDGMEQLQELLTTCPEIEKHLCLSSTTRDRELAETVKRFGRYSIDRLIFTHLDESETFGSIINVLLQSNLPPSFLAAGQSISGDLEVATAGRLSELAMGVKLS
jgi:flagellar biosynthesis protein FlhF